MLLPKNINPKIQPIIYMIVCSLHGFLFGTLYAPAQALFFNLDFEGTIAWIIAGLPYDLIHGVSNFICGLLIVPIISVLKKVDNYAINK
jgi:energy-coupling factor transport system substrate-specific component